MYCLHFYQLLFNFIVAVAVAVQS